MNEETNPADLAQRVVDLGAQRDSYKAAFAEWLPFAHYMYGLVLDGTAPADSLGHHCANVAIETIKRLIRQRDKLNHQHHTVRADAQARVDAAVIRALAAEKDRDEWRQLASAYSPAKELAEALKQAKASGGAARKERDELRARLAELEQKEPVAHLCRYRSGEEFASLARRPLNDKDVESSLPLYARPVPAIPEGWRLVNAGALAMVVSALRRDAEEGRPVRGEMADELIAAPEHKA